MARPKREIVMARYAREALLAAIETYNRPTAEYREQTVAFLLVNAWEILAKARIIQMNGGRLRSIYRRKRDSRRYERGGDGEILTLRIKGALNRSGVPEEVKKNIYGLIKVRNQATHMGVLGPHLKQVILEFSTASVQNFVKAYHSWFGESFDAPYLLPLGFVGAAQAAIATYPARQRHLLEELSELAKSQDVHESGFSVVLQVHVELNRGISGGGNIGLSTDPSFPKVSISDDEALKTFPYSYSQLVDICRERYSDFKANQRFHGAMKSINEDPSCVHERRLDPKNEKSPRKRFYNIDNSMAKLDDEYIKAN